MQRAPLMPLAAALEQLLAHAQPLREQETLATLDADGRVLAQDVVSALHVPPQDNSAMDGYAVRCADVVERGVVLPVSQRIAAGGVGSALQPLSVARIFTGAPVPPGVDAVLMQEDCTLLPEPDASGQPQVRFDKAPMLGQNIRRAGEDVSLGAVVLARGQRLGPAELGLAASIGLGALNVVRRPRVALFSTGDELVMPGTVLPQNMPPGAIYNSNRFFFERLAAPPGL